jgi:hypothetical protein
VRPFAQALRNTILEKAWAEIETIGQRKQGNQQPGGAEHRDLRQGLHFPDGMHGTGHGLNKCSH